MGSKVQNCVPSNYITTLQEETARPIRMKLVAKAAQRAPLADVEGPSRDLLLALE